MSNATALTPSRVSNSRPADDPVVALYLAYGDTVRRLVAARLRHDDRDLVDDLSQDVWLAVTEHVRHGRYVRTPLGLLATIARHRVADHYRAAHTRRSTPADWADVVQARRLPAAPSAEAEALAVETVRELVAA